MPDTELLIRKAQALPSDCVREAIDYMDYLMLKAAESGSLALSVAQRNSAFAAKIDKARTDLAAGKGIALSTEQMEALEDG